MSFPILWCFASPAVLALQDTINERYRWAAMTPSSSPPPWVKKFEGNPFILCQTIAGYSYSLGPFHSRLYKGPSSEEMLRRKHPEWSANKLRRAVADSQEQHHHKSDSEQQAANEFLANEVAPFFKLICRDGPVTLILDDGGSVHPEHGGTRGLDLATRSPRMDQMGLISLDRFELFQGLKFWVPVRFERGD